MITFEILTHSKIDSIINMMQQFYAIDNYPFDVEISKNLFSEFIKNENLGKAFLIFRENQLVGYVILTLIFSFEYQGKIAFLDELYVSKIARRQGIGNKAVDFVKQETKRLGVKLIYLEVENNNTNAQKMYLDNGFVFHNRKMMKVKL
jgi:ribosomal protein S18 acetylase RimI-like enzyme